MFRYIFRYCVIAAPADGKIDETSGSIVDSNGSAAGNVVIQSTSTAAENLKPNQPSRAKKILKDGNLYILMPDGRTCNEVGSEIK